MDCETALAVCGCSLTVHLSLRDFDSTNSLSHICREELGASPGKAKMWAELVPSPHALEVSGSLGSASIPGLPVPFSTLCCPLPSFIKQT